MKTTARQMKVGQELPPVLFIGLDGSVLDMHLGSRVPLDGAVALHKALNNVLQQQDYTVGVPDIVAPPGPNPLGRQLLQFRLTGKPEQPDFWPVHFALQTQYRKDARLGRRLSTDGTDPIYTVYFRQTVTVNERSLAKLGRKDLAGFAKKDNSVEFWLNPNATGVQVWETAQRIADLANAYVFGDLVRGR